MAGNGLDSEPMSTNNQNESLRIPDACAIVIVGVTGDFTKAQIVAGSIQSGCN
jgi:hypothetical protein